MPLPEAVNELPGSAVVLHQPGQQASRCARAFLPRKQPQVRRAEAAADTLLG